MHTSERTVLPAVFTRIEPIARETVLYTLDLDAPMPFRAGQFVNLVVPGARPRGERSYTIWSAPTSSSQIELCVRLLPDGAASDYLRARSVGDRASLRGPFGRFTLPDDVPAAIFVATGTGLAPFRSILADRAPARDGRPIHLLFGCRAQPDLFATEEIARFSEVLPSFGATVCLSRPEPGWAGYSGRVTDAFRARWPSRCPLPEGCHVYLCGNGGMIEDMRGLLRELHGIGRPHVHVEKYW